MKTLVETRQKLKLKKLDLTQNTAGIEIEVAQAGHLEVETRTRREAVPIPPAAARWAAAVHLPE